MQISKLSTTPINWTTFTLKIPINSPKQTIFNAWTKASEVEKWFLKSCSFNDENGEIPSNQTTSAGNTYSWIWHIYPDVETGKILETDGHSHFSFTFAGDCIVSVRFTEAHGQTLVELTQSNIPTDDASRKNIRLGCHYGWSFHLLNLKSIYEGGIDLRNTDERFPPMLNN